MAKGNDDEIFDHSRRGMFVQRALKSAGVFYGAYAALRFNRKAPNPVVSRGPNDKHKLILKKITHRACLFAPLPEHSLQRTRKILRPPFLAGSPALRNHGARRRPRSLTDFLITIKTHSPLLSTKTYFLFRNGVNWYDRAAGRASAVLRKLRVRHCQNWQAVPDRIAPTHQRL